MHVHKVVADCLNIGYALTTLGQKCTKCISSSIQSCIHPFQPTTLSNNIETLDDKIFSVKDIKSIDSVLVYQEKFCSERLKNSIYSQSRRLIQ